MHLGLLRKLQQAEIIVIQMDRKDAWVSTEQSAWSQWKSRKEKELKWELENIHIVLFRICFLKKSLIPDFKKMTN